MSQFHEGAIFLYALDVKKQRSKRDALFPHNKEKKPVHTPRHHTDTNPVTPYQLGRASVFTGRNNPFVTNGVTLDYREACNFSAGVIECRQQLNTFAQTL